jgi:hypothetical protein
MMYVNKLPGPDCNLPETHTLPQANLECLRLFFSCSPLARQDPSCYEEQVQLLGSEKSGE